MDFIQEFIEQDDPFSDYEDCRKIWESFLSDYPVNRISNLSLEEYNYTGRKSTFCYRLQHEVRCASMGNAFPGVFGVYLNSQSQPIIDKSLSKIYGNNYEAAFVHIKKEIIRLLEAGEKGDYCYIKGSKINQQFRFKLLCVYFPEKYFPVCTRPRAEKYCNALGITIMSSDTMTDLNYKLVQWKNQKLPAEWTLFHAMAFSEWLLQRHIKLDNDYKYSDAPL